MAVKLMQIFDWKMEHLPVGMMAVQSRSDML